MSWFSKGKESVQQAAQVQEELRKNRAPYRVRVLPQKTVPVVYLDDEGFSFQEHTVQNGRRWEQWTCSGPATCPLCQSGDKPYFVTLFSVIEMTEWTDSRGQTHKNEKKIHALKSESALVLMNKKERWNGLKGKAVYLTRKGDKDPSSGSDFELMLHPQKNTPIVYKLDSAKPEHAPFDYASIFEPKSPDFVRTALGMNSQVSGFSAPSMTSSAPSMPALSSMEILDPMGMNDDEPAAANAAVPF